MDVSTLRAQHVQTSVLRLERPRLVRNSRGAVCMALKRVHVPHLHCMRRDVRMQALARCPSSAVPKFSRRLFLPNLKRAMSMRLQPAKSVDNKSSLTPACSLPLTPAKSSGLSRQASVNPLTRQTSFKRQTSIGSRSSFTLNRRKMLALQAQAVLTSRDIAAGFSSNACMEYAVTGSLAEKGVGEFLTETVFDSIDDAFDVKKNLTKSAANVLDNISIKDLKNISMKDLKNVKDRATQIRNEVAHAAR